MAHIKKVKTWYGIRYAVVEPFTVTFLSENKKWESRTNEFPIEYKEGNQIRIAQFPVTAEGLKDAKQVQSLVNS